MTMTPPSSMPLSSCCGQEEGALKKGKKQEAVIGGWRGGWAHGSCYNSMQQNDVMRCAAADFPISSLLGSRGQQQIKGERPIKQKKRRRKKKKDITRLCHHGGLHCVADPPGADVALVEHVGERSDAAATAGALLMLRPLSRRRGGAEQSGLCLSWDKRRKPAAAASGGARGRGGGRRLAVRYVVPNSNKH